MRFLNYSLEHDKAIKAVLLIDGKMRQLNIKVQRITGDGFEYTSERSKKIQYCKLTDVMATGYGRGDKEGK